MHKDVLIVAYSSRCSAIADALYRSDVGFRTVAFVGLGSTIEIARRSARGAALDVQRENPFLELRNDVATRPNITKSVQHMESLRK